MMAHQSTSDASAGKSYLLPLVLVTSLFFLWAIGVNLNDILIPHLKKAFGLSDFKSSLIQSAFFGGYFLAALPAGWLMERVGYRWGILTGLLLCATGALLFLPAASVRVYGVFLFALFVMACGQCFLEVAANPYVTVLGPAQTSERRLNIAQSFNSVGAVVTPFFGAAFILSGVEYTRSQLAAMSPEQVLAYSVAEANMVKIPYLFIAGLFLSVAALIYFSHLPEIQEPGDASQPAGITPTIRDTLAHRHLALGVIAQFLYVGAQVGVASFIIRFVQQTLPGTPEKIAANFLKFHLLGFMIGRFSGSALMKVIAAPKLLCLFAVGCIACVTLILTGSGTQTVWCIVLLGFFHSIMFPTIFALSLKQLGSYTKLGSSLLVMSIIGGAICPAIMGLISDASNIQRAFVVPLIAYLFILFFAVKGYLPVGSQPKASTGEIGVTAAE